MNAVAESNAANQVVMYSTGWCGFCDRARALLNRKGVSVAEIKVDEDIAERDTMLKRSGGRRTVPQIFIGQYHVGGYQELAQLERTGELDRLLQR
ncbi:MAG TPA: glutaredoxin 3 [Steroidobacteraceae bacterium]|nr:glutaredoxin 3 [Steroidobacteraceae bacterium]